MTSINLLSQLQEKRPRGGHSEVLARQSLFARLFVIVALQEASVSVAFSDVLHSECTVAYW